MNLTQTVQSPAKGHPIMAFILGLLSANNIAYAFVVGSTPILVICIYALICLGWLIIERPSRLDQILSAIPKSLLIFFLCTLLSVGFVLIFHADYMYQWFMGIIELLMYTLIILTVVVLKDNFSSIINGILWGIVINAIFAIFAYILYRGGIIFTLSTMFPAWKMPVLLIYNDYRAWGLFLEPGHLMRYTAIMSILVYANLDKSRKITKWIFLLSVATIMIFTISSSLIIFVVGILLFFILRGRVNFAKSLYAFLALALGISVIYLLAQTSPLIQELWNSFVEGLFNFTASDSSNTDRLTGMKSAIKVIGKYLVTGCGWNTFTMVFQELGFYTQKVRGSYSALLSLFAELGVGAFAYIAFVVESIRKNISKKTIQNIAIACSIIIYFALYTLTDYGLNGDCAVFIGFIIVQSIKNKEDARQTLNGEI